MRRSALITHWLCAVLFASVVAVTASESRAIEIEKVVSDSGVVAWLVEEPSVPLVAMSFAFRGGATEDPPAKPGVANLLSTLLDEGAGDIDSQAFQARLAELAIDLSFDANRDTFHGSLETLVENRDEAAELLRLVLTAPRFDDEPVARMKDAVAAGMLREQRDPDHIASRALSEALFGNHPYADPVEGTLETLASITAEDLRRYMDRTFARDNLTVAVVGAVDAVTLRGLLDEVFGDLPAATAVSGADEIEPATVGLVDIAMTIPQAVVRFAMPGPKRHDPDFIPAYVAAHILGGGGSGARLYDEVRGRRGLAYSIGLGLAPLEHAGLVAGGTSTRSDQADEVIAIVQEELARFAEEGPTAQELESAKSYLIGSYPLRFTTSTRIAGQLLGIQLDGLGIDYVDRRNEMIEAITLEDVRAVAQRLFGSGEMTVVKVGPPAG